MKIFQTIALILLSSLCFGQNPASSGYLLTKSNGSVSIGTEVNTALLTVSNFSTTFPSPQAGTIVHLLSDAVTNGRISFDTYNNASIAGSNYQGRRARGTAAIPTAATVDDILVAMGGDGYGDDSYTGVSVGSVNIRANGTFTNASKPTYISFTTTPSGSITQVERVRIKPDGVFQITGLNAVGYVQTDASGNLSTAALATNLVSIGALANGNGFLKNNGSGTFTYENPAGSGTVTDVSVVTANGFGGSVATSTSTPAITITTGITGILKGNGTAISAASAGTDYLAPNGNGSALTGLTATQVGLGNVTNESKATMFTSPTFTGTPVVPGYLPNTTTAGVGSSPTASSTTTITHNLGRVPAIIRIYGYGTFTSNAAATATTSSMGVFNSSGNFCVYQRFNTAAITTTQAGLSSNTFSILLSTGANNFISGVIQNVTSTQFDIVWTETGTATAQVYMWEAQ